MELTLNKKECKRLDFHGSWASPLHWSNAIGQIASTYVAITGRPNQDMDECDEEPIKNARHCETAQP